MRSFSLPALLMSALVGAAPAGEVRHHDDAALGLDRLDEDRDGFLRVDSGFNRV